MRLFIFALIVRLIWVAWSGSSPLCTDSQEYFLNSRDLELVIAAHGETAVLQHNPGMVLWAHLVHPIFPWAQAVAGAGTCLLLESMYPGAGWLLAVWIPHIAATGLWLKWIIAGFCFTLAWRAFLWKRWSPVLTGPALVVLFWSLLPGNLDRDSAAPLWRLAGFWMPITELGGRSWPGLSLTAVAWLVFLPLLIRILSSWSAMLLVLSLSLGAVLTFGVAQQRLPFEPVLLGLLVNEGARLWGHGSSPSDD